MTCTGFVCVLWSRLTLNPVLANSWVRVSDEWPYLCVINLFNASKFTATTVPTRPQGTINQVNEWETTERFFLSTFPVMLCSSDQRVIESRILSQFLIKIEMIHGGCSIVLAMTSVLAIVSLFFSVVHHLCRHFFSHLHFMFCFSESMLICDTILSLVCSLSLSLYVLDNAVLSSPFIPHFLVLGHSPFSSFRLHTWSVESLSSSAGRNSFIRRESSQIDGSAVSLRNELESVESTETRRMETKSLWRTDIFSRGDVSDTVTDVSYHRGKCKELCS